MEHDNIGNDEKSSVIKHGHKWSAENIKEELDQHLLINSNVLNHEFRYDRDDKYFYIYDNECFLFVFDEKIELRCDRDNVFSENITFTYKIKEAKDIIVAYDKFKSTTMEGEEE